jgi:tRNA pseudouridine55 synthase
MNGDLSNINFEEGTVLLFDKPLDWTSFDVVNKVRWAICKKLKIKKIKVGHAGTLDPKATGLVVVCTGKATKNIDQLQAGEKEYFATLKLGATTPSYDLETEENSNLPTNGVTSELIEEKIKDFIGVIDQVPPTFSAIKVNGKRAFKYARLGKEMELDARKVEIREIEIVTLELPNLVLRITCGKGTYIRALARDLGNKLGCGAYLVGLIRTRVGDDHLEDAWTLEQFEKSLFVL